MFNVINPDHDAHVAAHYLVMRRLEIEAQQAKARAVLIKAGKLKG